MKKILLPLLVACIAITACNNKKVENENTPTGRPNHMEEDTTAKTQELRDSASTGQSLLNKNPEQQKGSPK